MRTLGEELCPVCCVRSRMQEATADGAKFLSQLVFTGSASDYRNAYVIISAQCFDTTCVKLLKTASHPASS